MTTLGVIFTPDQPPENLRAVALAADAAGLDQLWVWEDCFAESGIASAAAALGWTQRLAVGMGLLPVPLRNVALTAMELATVERLFPGRLVPGIGHGVLDWMAQVGLRAESPLTLLNEYTAALSNLLQGQRVTTHGQYVHLDAVGLDWPPHPSPPLLVGGRRPKTIATAATLADGVIFDEQVDLAAIGNAMPGYRAARERAGKSSDGLVVKFCGVEASESAQHTAERVSELVAVGVTHTIFRATGDGARPLDDFATYIAEQVAPLVP